jgi:hypothetical protein
MKDSVSSTDYLMRCYLVNGTGNSFSRAERVGVVRTINEQGGDPCQILVDIHWC